MSEQVKPVAWERFKPIVIVKGNVDAVITREDFLKIKKLYEQKHRSHYEPLLANVWKNMNFYIFNSILEMVLHENLHEQSMEVLQNYYEIDPHKFIRYICVDIYEIIRDEL